MISILRKNKKIIITGGVVLFFFISLLLFYFLFKNDEELVEEDWEVVIETNIPEEEEEEKEEELLIDAEAVLSVHYNDGKKKVLYSKNKDEVLPIASISKLMTALIVFENYDLNEAVDVVGVANFKGWKETKIKSVVSQMIVESNNISAFVLAIISDRFLEKEKENIDSFQLFVKEMNKKAEKIGLENTFFINPSGLGNGNNYNKSTATEIAELSIYILENQKEIFDISKTPIYYVYSPDGTIYYKSFNTNFLVYNSEKDWQEEMIGGKTGTTYMAGQCLLIVFKNPEDEGYIINVILGSQDRFEDMKKLINYARSNS